jgi:hypothetical protein
LATFCNFQAGYTKEYDTKTNNNNLLHIVSNVIGDGFQDNILNSFQLNQSDITVKKNLHYTQLSKLGYPMIIKILPVKRKLKI